MVFFSFALLCLQSYLVLVQSRSRTPVLSRGSNKFQALIFLTWDAMLYILPPVSLLDVLFHTTTASEPLLQTHWDVVLGLRKILLDFHDGLKIQMIVMVMADQHHVHAWKVRYFTRNWAITLVSKLLQNLNSYYRNFK